MILKYLRKKTKASKSPEEKEADREKSNEIDNENLQTDKNRCGRRGRRQNRSIDEKFELVKNQCGRHDLVSIAKMLNLHSSRLKLRI